MVQKEQLKKSTGNLTGLLYCLAVFALIVANIVLSPDWPSFIRIGLRGIY